MNFDTNRRTARLGSVLAVVLAMPLAARAGSIGVNFGSTSMALAATDLAGVPGFAQVNWNNVSAAATGLVLNDSTGVATTAALTTTNTSISLITSAVADPDEKLNSGRATCITTPSFSFAIASIPYASYSILVYDHQFASGSTVGITIGATSYYTQAPVYNAAGYLDNNASTPFIYTQGTSTSSSAPTPVSNYVLFTGLSGSSQTVVVNGLTTTTPRVGGFQIIETVPEPATIAGIGIGIAALARRRRPTASGRGS